MLTATVDPSPSKEVRVSHAYSKLVQFHMDANSWNASDLSEVSGLTRAHISGIINDKRDHLKAIPDVNTLRALSRAFKINVDVLLAAAAKSAGLNLYEAPLPDVDAISDAELLYALGRRLDRRTSVATAAAHQGDEPTLDLNSMDEQSIPQIIDLIERLRDEAEEAEKRGDVGLCQALMFLVANLERAQRKARAELIDPANPHDRVVP